MTTEDDKEAARAVVLELQTRSVCLSEVQRTDMPELEWFIAKGIARARLQAEGAAA